jgi:hypothetical protein
MTNLADTIDALYTVFGRNSDWSRELPCPCCGDPANAEPLKHTKLSDLTREQLQPYVDSALTTWGNAADYKHFLPRLLELSTQGDPDWDCGMVLAKVEVADFSTWSDDERTAVENFARAWWHATLEAFPAKGSAADPILCLSIVFPDIAPYLDAWRDLQTTAARRHAAHCWQEISNEVWQPAAQTNRIRAWLSDQRTLDWLLECYLQNPDETWSKVYTQSIDELQWSIDAGHMKREAR